MSELRAAGVRAGYDGREVLRGVDLIAREAELVALVGPNGAGKSTLLRVLAGLVPRSAGTVTIGGVDLASLDRAAVARRVAVVPQIFDTLFPFTAGEVVALGRTPRLGRFGIARREDLAAVSRAMAALEIDDLAQRRIDRLSGGERQRVVLAMALAQEPDVLLLDEPTAHLDPAHQATTLAHIAALARERGIAVVAVLHDLNLAAAFAARVVLLADGIAVRDGAPEHVITADLVRRVFGPGLRVIAHDGRPFVIPEPADVGQRGVPSGVA